MPIVLPILLITLASFAKILHFPEEFTRWLSFLGSPLVSFLLAIFFSYSLFPENAAQRMMACFKSGIEHCGTTLVLVGAGGAFGAILKETSLKEMVSEWLLYNEMSGGLPADYCLSDRCFFKTAQEVYHIGHGAHHQHPGATIGVPRFCNARSNNIGGDGSRQWRDDRLAYQRCVVLGGIAVYGISAKDTYRTHTVLTGLQGVVSFATMMSFVFYCWGKWMSAFVRVCCASREIKIIGRYATSIMALCLAIWLHSVFCILKRRRAPQYL